MIRHAFVSKRVQKDLDSLPLHVKRLFLNWVEDVEEHGLEEVRRIPGYHDEPIKGDRFGQRSIRLNRAYRVFYRIVESHVVTVVVQEVNKHDF